MRDPILRFPVLGHYPDPPAPLGPYEIMLPPGKFDIHVRNDHSSRPTPTQNPWEWDERLFEYKKTLILDGSKDEIELDIVLEEVEKK
jgi:hypothetical protein